MADKGWECTKVPGSRGVWMLGKPGEIGCAAIRRCSDGLPVLDVCLYKETPEQVVQRITKKKEDTSYVVFVMLPEDINCGQGIVEEIYQMLR